MKAVGGLVTSEYRYESETVNLARRQEQDRWQGVAESNQSECGGRTFRRSAPPLKF